MDRYTKYNRWKKHIHDGKKNASFWYQVFWWSDTLTGWMKNIAIYSVAITSFLKKYIGDSKEEYIAMGFAGLNGVVWILSNKFHVTSRANQYQRIVMSYIHLATMMDWLEENEIEEKERAEMEKSIRNRMTVLRLVLLKPESLQDKNVHLEKTEKPDMELGKMTSDITMDFKPNNLEQSSMDAMHLMHKSASMTKKTSDASVLADSNIIEVLTIRNRKAKARGLWGKLRAATLTPVKVTEENVADGMIALTSLQELSESDEIYDPFNEASPVHNS